MFYINISNLFSKLSLINSLLTLGAFVYLFISMPSSIKVSDGLPEPDPGVIVAAQMFCITGLIMMILSFVRKEPTSWYKSAGAFLNILWFLVLMPGWMQRVCRMCRVCPGACIGWRRMGLWGEW